MNLLQCVFELCMGHVLLSVCLCVCVYTAVSVCSVQLSCVCSTLFPDAVSGSTTTMVFLEFWTTSMELTWSSVNTFQASGISPSRALPLLKRLSLMPKKTNRAYIMPTYLLMNQFRPDLYQAAADGIGCSCVVAVDIYNHASWYLSTYILYNCVHIAI